MSDREVENPVLKDFKFKSAATIHADVGEDLRLVYQRDDMERVKRMCEVLVNWDA